MAITDKELKKMLVPVQIVPIDQVKPNPNNPRIIRNAKFQNLLDSLKDDPEMTGVRELVVNPEWEVVGGNQRLRAMQELGWTHVPVKQISWEEIKIQRFVIKDNIPYGEWNEEMLANEWTAEELEYMGLDIPGWEDEQQKVKDDNYKVPETIETNIKPGDLIQIGTHRLLCGDATNPAHYEKLMGGATANMVLTDPPYNVNYEGTAGKIQNDNQEDAAFFEFLLRAFSASLDHTKPGGAFYIWHADSEGLNFRRAMTEAGIKIRQCLIWVKNSLVMGRQDYQWRHEPCLYGWKEGAAHHFRDSRAETTVLEDEIDLKQLKRPQLEGLLREILEDKLATTVIKHDKPTVNDLHPTMKPVTLMGYLIQNSSKPGQTVLDPFSGSGSTMVAAEQIKRDCFAMELDPKYCAVIIDRMRKLKPELQVKVNGKFYKE